MKCTKLVSGLAIAALLTIGGGTGCKKRLGKTTLLPDRGGRPSDELPTGSKDSELPNGKGLGDGKGLTGTDRGPVNGNPFGNPNGSGNSNPNPFPVNPKDQTGEGIRPSSGVGFENADEDRATFADDTVHFDFDKYVVREKDKGKLDHVANQIKSMPGKGLKVEGHCDERGTEEYNRALGERRALAVREYLVSRGVDPSIVLTISFGEDMPADPGHSEAAWAKNRRGEIILLTPKK